MQDRVADVLAQRAALDRGAWLGVAVSILLHAALGAVMVYAALHAPAPRPATMVNIQFANLPAMTKPAEAPKKAAAPAPAAPAPAIEEPKPVIEPPKPEPPATTPPKPDKNTVPLSPFGQSTKKGSEMPAPPVPKPQPPAQPGGTGGPAAGAADVPVGGSGITGLEGGDFPYAIYLEGMQRKIGTNWFRPTVAAGTEVIVYYRIQRDGKITDVSVFKSSGNSAFDRAARSAVQSSSPLNPLPFAYTGTYLGVHLTFR